MTLQSQLTLIASALGLAAIGGGITVRLLIAAALVLITCAAVAVYETYHAPEREDLE